jgi:hypothetical protein
LIHAARNKQHPLGERRSQLLTLRLVGLEDF